MTNVYYNSNGDPVFLSFGASAKIRNQFTAVAAGFDGVAAALAASAQPAQLIPAVNINPDCIFDQVNEGALYTVSGLAVKAIDGWSGEKIGAGEFKLRRVTDPDNASQKCMEITCTTADATIGATDTYGVYTAVEGYDMANFKFGTSAVQAITVFIRLKTSVTGVYGLQVINSALNRAYVGQINVVDANEHDYTVTLTGDTTGAWDYTTGVGAIFRIALAEGANFHGTLNTWQAGTPHSPNTQCNFMSNTANIAYLKKFHVMPYVAVPVFAPADVGAQLRKCQRYFVKTFSQGTAVAQGSGSAATALTHSVAVAGVATQHLSWRFPVTMRSAPSMIAYNPVAAGTVWYNVLDGADSGASSFVAAGADSAIIAISQLAGDGVGDILVLHVIADARLI